MVAGVRTPDLGRYGIWCGELERMALGEGRELVAELDEQGWGSLWISEAYGREAFTAAMTWLSASPRLVLGTGIANIYARDAMACAAAARTLHHQFPDRFVLGLGVSHAPLVERMRKHTYASPVETMRTYLEALDAAIAGVAGEGERPARVLAALGPKMLALSGELAEGAHPYLVTPEHTARAREILGPGPVVVVEQSAVISDAGDDDFWQRAHSHLEIYTGLPNYRNSWARLGFSTDDFVRGGTRRLAEALVTRGVEATQSRVEEHLAAGATSVVTQVLGNSRRDYRALADALLG